MDGGQCGCATASAPRLFFFFFFPVVLFVRTVRAEGLAYRRRCADHTPKFRLAAEYDRHSYAVHDDCLARGRGLQP